MCRHFPLPVLRKDFIIDPYQITESRAYGADCILLIVAALEPEVLPMLHEEAAKQGMDVLVEVHNEAQLERALALGEPLQLLGINNRNLENFAVDLETSSRLAALIPADRRARITVVSESGVAGHADIERLAGLGIHAVLVGESLLTADKPQEQLAQLLGKA